MLRVNYVKESHRDKKVVETFEQWIEFIYGDPNFGKVKSLKGKIHEHLFVTLYYTTKVEVKIDM